MKADTKCDIADLQLDQNNIRVRPEAAKAAIRNSLEQFGAARSVVMDGEGIIRAGNGTVEAAQAAGVTKARIVEASPDELIVVHRPDLTGEKATAYAIADNRTGELAEWDIDGLDAQLEALTEYEPSDLGFDDAAMSDLFPEAEAEVEDVEPQMDRADELEEQWGTAEGQLWVIEGKQEHRLLCGDSSSKDAVERLMAGQRATCIFTDPPYGVGVAAKNRMLNTVQPSGRCLVDIEDDNLSPVDLKAKLLPAFNLIRETVMAEDCTLFVTAPQGGDLGMMMMMMLREAKLAVRHVLMWYKNAPTFSMGRLDYDYQHEPILLTWGKKHKRPMNGQFKTSVWSVDKPRQCDLHPTMKPVELYVNACQNNSDVGDNVADLYSGSGTAFLAAEKTGRQCFGMELTPRYCAVILQRMTDAGCSCRVINNG